MYTVRMPSIVQGRSAKIRRWRKQLGDWVREHDILVEIETDEEILEIPANVEGVLRSILMPQGSLVFANDKIALLDAPSQQETPHKDAQAPHTRLNIWIRRIVPFLLTATISCLHR